MLLSVPMGMSRTGCGTVTLPCFHTVLKLLVTPLVRNFIPAVFPQTLDDLPTAHG